MKPLIIYHANCFDGFASAYWAYISLKKDSTPLDKGDYVAELFPAYYSSSPPDVSNREVYILDFSYDRNTLLKMKNEAKSLLVIDHHITSQEELKDLDFCIFDQNHSGAMLTYLEFGRGNDAHETPTPENAPILIKYVEDKDLNKFDLPYSEEINEYIRSHSFDIDEWINLDLQLSTKEGLEKAIEIGKAQVQVKQSFIEKTKKYIYFTDFEGYNIPVINVSYWNISDLLNDACKGEKFAVGYFKRHDGKWQYSLRSKDNNIDLSKIASKYGGGGHKQAAGFELNELIF